MLRSTETIDQGCDARGARGGIVVCNPQLGCVTQAHAPGDFSTYKTQAPVHSLEYLLFVVCVTERADKDRGTAHVGGEFHIHYLD